MSTSSFAPIMNSLVERYADYVELCEAQHSPKLTVEQMDMLHDTITRMWERSALVLLSISNCDVRGYTERTLALLEERKAMRLRRVAIRKAHEARRERERDEHVARILMEALCE